MAPKKETVNKINSEIDKDEYRNKQKNTQKICFLQWKSRDFVLRLLIESTEIIYDHILFTYFLPASKINQITFQISTK